MANAQAAPSASAPRKKIVVINDDTAYLELMKEFLQDHDFDVTVFKEPDVTPQRLHNQRPDVLVVDLIFGKEPNGWLIIQHMRSDVDTRDIPILMCSAAVEQMHARAAEFAEPNIAFLEKPFELATMLAILNRLLVGA